MLKLLRLRLPVVFFTALPFMVSSQSLSINIDGSTANASALLDVKSTIKGLLIPRMTREQRDAISSPATGLMIFQNAPDSMGLYYYNGTGWTWVLSNSNTDSLAWRTDGNTGTVDGTSFIGTRDNVPFNIRVNNQKAGKLDPALFNSFYGYHAGNANSTGSNNSAFGSGADVISGALTNATAIGANAIVSASNSLILGNNANVGIGISAPTEKLHVIGNLRYDGALMSNGNAGTTGQLLISQGPGVAPNWGPIGGLITTFKNTPTRTLITSTAFTQVAGLTRTITLTTNADVIISTYGSIETTSGVNAGSQAIIQVFNNGVAISDMFQTIDVDDAVGFSGTIAPWSMMNSLSLTPGSYTFTVRARKVAFDNFYAGGNTTAPNPNEGAMILMVIPK
jgi:trimeric autotransporter adhesin